MTLSEAAGLIEKHQVDGSSVQEPAEDLWNIRTSESETKGLAGAPKSMAEKLLLLDSPVETIMNDSSHGLSGMNAGDEHFTESMGLVLQCIGLSSVFCHICGQHPLHLVDQSLVVANKRVCGSGELEICTASIPNKHPLLHFSDPQNQDPKQKIFSRPCRTTLYSPTYCNIQEAYKESVTLPAEDLELEHVHGYLFNFQSTLLGYCMKTEVMSTSLRSA